LATVLSALAELVANAVGSLLIGWIPERQPWRAVVVTLYAVLALAGVAVLVWAVVTAV